MAIGIYIKKIPGWALSILSLIIGITIWQTSTNTPQALIPSPFIIGQTFYDLLVSGEFLLHFQASFKRLLPGWCLGLIIGSVVGLLIGISRVALSIFIPWLALLFPIPKIALLPLFIILFGIDDLAKIITIAFGVLFLTAFCIYQGVKAVPEKLIAMGQSFELPNHIIIRKIILPGALPGFFLALRLTTPMALIVLVASEMLGAQEGIGALILAAGSIANMNILFAATLSLSFLGLILMLFWHTLERKVVHWQQDVNLFK